MAAETLLVNIKALDNFTGTFQRLQAQAGASTKSVSKLGYIAGAAAVGGIVLLAKGLWDCTQAAMEAERVTAETEAIIKSTGGVAKVSSEHIGTLATKIQNYSGFSDEAVRSGANMLLTFKKVRNEAGAGNDVFDQGVHLLADMARKFDTDMPSAAKQLGKALEDPISGVTALRRMGVQLDKQQQGQIKRFMEVGDILSAQKIILGEVESQVGNVAEAYGTTLAGKLDILKQKFDDMKETIGAAFIPIFSEIADKVSGAVTEITPTVAELAQSFAALGSEALENSGLIETLTGTLQSLGTIMKFINDTGMMKAITELNKWAEQLNMLSGGIFNLLGYLVQLQQKWAEVFGKETISREAASGVEAAKDFWSQMEKESNRGVTVLDTSAKKAMKKITQAIVKESPVAVAQQGILMDALKDVINAKGLDLQNATANDITMMAQAIAAQTGVPVEAVQNILNQMVGRVSSTTLSADPMMQSLLASINSWKGVIAAAVGSIAIGAVTAVSNVFSRLPFHQGGAVHHQGGAVRAHGGAMMTDERQIIAQTGEGVVSRKGMKAMGGVRTLNAINRGDVGGGGPTIILQSTFSMASDSEMRRAAKKLNKYLVAEGAR